MTTVLQMNYYILSQDKLTDFLQNLLSTVQHLISAVSVISPLSVRQVNQVIYSLDVFTHAMAHRTQSDPTTRESGCPIWPCMESDGLDSDQSNADGESFLQD